MKLWAILNILTTFAVLAIFIWTDSRLQTNWDSSDLVGWCLQIESSSLTWNMAYPWSVAYGVDPNVEQCLSPLLSILILDVVSLLSPETHPCLGRTVETEFVFFVSCLRSGIKKVSFITMHFEWSRKESFHAKWPGFWAFTRRLLKTTSWIISFQTQNYSIIQDLTHIQHLKWSTTIS